MQRIPIKVLILVGIIVFVPMLLYFCFGIGRGKPKLKGEELSLLVSECEQLARDGKAHGKTYWEASELPPVVRSLSPQFVQLITTGVPPPIINIQISGGFEHGGFWVVCGTTNANYIPPAGDDWPVTKISPQVFHYQE